MQYELQTVGLPEPKFKLQNDTKRENFCCAYTFSILPN